MIRNFEGFRPEIQQIDVFYDWAKKSGLRRLSPLENNKFSFYLHGDKIEILSSKESKSMIEKISDEEREINFEEFKQLIKQ